MPTDTPDLTLTFPHSPDYTPVEWGRGWNHTARKRVRVMFAVGLVGLIGFAFLMFALTRWGGNNFHVVSEGEFFRIAQVSPDETQTIVKLHGIKTVLALRGANEEDERDNNWLEAESTAVAKEGAKVVNTKMATSRAPWRSELRALFQALDNLEYPVLVHCKQGSDRTGLVSAIWLHDYRANSMAQARKQLNFFPYMHFKWGNAGAVDILLDDYEAWTRAHPGEPMNIRDWVKQHWFFEKEGRELEPWYDGVMYRP